MVVVPKYGADVRSQFIFFPGGSLDQVSSTTVMNDSFGGTWELWKSLGLLPIVILVLV